MLLELYFLYFKSDESEDEEPCAISNKWAYERCSQRWSRLESLDGSPGEEGSSASVPDSPRLKSTGSEDISFSDHGGKHDASSIHSTSSGDSDIISFPKTFEDIETSRSSSRCSSSKVASPDSTLSGSPSPSEFLSIISEEKFLDKPPHKKGKSFLKKMEKLRIKNTSLKRDGHSKVKPIISEPVLLEGLDEEKLKNFNCVNICDLSDSQMKKNSSYSPQTCSSSSPSENSSTVSTPSPVIKVRSHNKRGGMYAEDFDSSKLLLWSDISEQNLNNEIHLQANQMFQIPQGHKPGTFPKALTNSFLSPMDNTSVNWRTGSFHGCRRNRIRTSCKDSETPASPLSFTDNRLSIYDNVPSIPFHLSKVEAEVGDDDVFSELDNVMEHVNGLRRLVSQWTEKFSDDGDSDFANDTTSPCPSFPKEIHLEIKHSEGKAENLSTVEGEQNCGHIGDLPYVTDLETGSHSSRSASFVLATPSPTPNQAFPSAILSV